MRPPDDPAGEGLAREGPIRDIPATPAGTVPGDVPPGVVYDMPPRELAERLRAANPPIVVDVREPWEYQVAQIPGARRIPLGTLPAALSTFDPNAEYVLVCHHGVRSLKGARFLLERGLTRVSHLHGGIDAWSTEVDPGVPRY